MNGNSKPPQTIAEALMSQLPTMSMEEQKVSLAIYRLLADSAPVRLEHLAAAANR